ncbi:MAG TPA: aldose epimerase family protein [Bryobacteraceae bacterium]|jgi:aldose 1-epimerase
MDKNKIIFALAAIAFALATESCGSRPPSATNFGKDKDGGTVQIYTLTNKQGMEARITPYGATLVSLKTPDRKGALADIVMGFDSVEGYTQTPPPPYFGATIGRYANRIGGAKFTLDGKTYTLDKNDGANSLHGGFHGFDKLLWTAKPSVTDDGQTLELSYLSKDGEEGYPGNLSVTVTYTLTPANEIRIHYTATTDKDTVINLTNHSYFNLGGHDAGDISDHLLTINADKFTPVDAGLIPTGELRDVEGTPFDFRVPHAVGERINADDEQIKLGRGYDHNWILNRTGTSLEFAARVTDPKSGRVIEVFTTEPAIQFYTGNFLDGSFHGKGGKLYQHRGALTLETQHYPDSPNHPDFPTTTLKAGQHFDSTTVFRFPARLP